VTTATKYIMRGAWQRGAVCGSVLQCVQACCSVMQCVAVCYDYCCQVYGKRGVAVVLCCSVFKCVAVCCSVLQCAAVCCSLLQCAATPATQYATRGGLQRGAV